MKRRRWIPVLLGALPLDLCTGSMCPGAVPFQGLGSIALTNSGHARHVEESVDVVLDKQGRVSVPMHGRVYFAHDCAEGAYDHQKYLALGMRNKKLRYTVDLSGAGCGCNAAFYLASMAQNSDAGKCGDYYCDANKVCGVNCAEIDIMEANRHAWQSTMHSAFDPYGVSTGYGGGHKDAEGKWSGNGVRDFTFQEYGPKGECVNTGSPFQVEVSFPESASGSLVGMLVQLTQTGRPCNVSMSVKSYKGMEELQKALWQGMTPVASFWKSKDMLWLDGKGSDKEGPCKAETLHCAGSIRLSDFSYVDGPPRPHTPPPPPTTPVPPPPAQPHAKPLAGQVPTTQAPAAQAPTAPVPVQVTSSKDYSGCAAQGLNCRSTTCCKTPGFRCYKRDWYWAECLEHCTASETGWSCVALGERTPPPGMASSPDGYSPLVSGGLEEPYHPRPRSSTSLGSIIVFMGLALLAIVAFLIWWIFKFNVEGGTKGRGLTSKSKGREQCCWGRSDGEAEQGFLLPSRGSGDDSSSSYFGALATLLTCTQERDKVNNAKRSSSASAPRSCT